MSFRGDAGYHFVNGKACRTVYATLLLSKTGSTAQVPPLPLAILSIGVPPGVRPSTLPLGQGGDEFAAEVGDVWDHPVPDQVGSGRETLKYVSHIHLRGPRMAPLARLVWVLVWDARERRRALAVAPGSLPVGELEVVTVSLLVLVQLPDAGESRAVVAPLCAAALSEPRGVASQCQLSAVEPDRVDPMDAARSIRTGSESP
jgi:hypothetical protein